MEGKYTEREREREKERERARERVSGMGCMKMFAACQVVVSIYV